MAPPDFGRSVYSISTKGTDYVHLITIGTRGFSDLPTALENCCSAAQWMFLMSLVTHLHKCIWVCRILNIFCCSLHAGWAGLKNQNK